MNYILDASAVVEIIASLRREARDALSGEATLDLALYETGNALWKWIHLKKILNAEDSSRILGSLSEALSILSVIRAELDDLPKILELSIKAGITFYDASYLYIAKKFELTLVTSDEELREAGRREGVSVISVEEFLREKGLER